MAQNHDEVLVILEEVSRVNKELVSENRVLREKMEKRDQEQRKILAELNEKLQNVVSDNNQTNRRRRRTKASEVKVPAPCRRITRQVYNTLMRKDDFDGFLLTESVHSEMNRRVMKTVLSEVFAQFNGPDKTPWSSVVIEAALKRYFVSQYELAKQKTDGKYEQHKKNCRRQGRKRDKLTKRTLALEKAELSTKKRGMAAEILLEQAMSSEESCVEEDENGKTKVVGYKVKRLSWESGKLRRIKQGLDKASKEGQTKRARDRALPRVEHEEKSTRLPPEDFPEWAISKE